MISNGPIERGSSKELGQHTSHAGNDQGRTPRQEPAQALDLTLDVTAHSHRDLVVELGDGRICGTLFGAHGHLAVIEHASQLVLQRERLLRHPLAQNVDLVLQVRPLATRLVCRHLATGRDFGTQLGARRPEEVGLLQ